MLYFQYWAPQRQQSEWGGSSTKWLGRPPSNRAKSASNKRGRKVDDLAQSVRITRSNSKTRGKAKAVHSKKEEKSEKESVNKFVRRAGVLSLRHLARPKLRRVISSRRIIKGLSRYIPAELCLLPKARAGLQALTPKVSESDPDELEVAADEQISSLAKRDTRSKGKAADEENESESKSGRKQKRSRK